MALIPDTLLSGHSHGKGVILKSPNGHYALSLSIYGVLTLLKKSPGVIIDWESGMPILPEYVGKPTFKVLMDTSGELLVLFKSSIIVWRSGTNIPGSYLKLRNSGKLVILDHNHVIWQQP